MKKYMVELVTNLVSQYEVEAKSKRNAENKIYEMHDWKLEQQNDDFDFSRADGKLISENGTEICTVRIIERKK